MRFVLLLLILTTPLISKALTLQEGIAKCKPLSSEERQKSPLCQKVIAKLKEIKAKKQNSVKTEPSKNATTESKPKVSDNSITPKNLEKMKKIKAKCQALSPPNQYKYKVCHQFMTTDNDPFLGKEKDLPAQYSLYTGYSLLGNISGFELEAERRSKHLGFGLFYSQQKISDLNNNEVSGSAFGASFRYHVTPLHFSNKSNLDFSGFLQLGLTKYTSELQGTLPSYFYVNMGLDASIPLFKMGSTVIRGYGKVGITHIYHSDSDFLNMGSAGALGLKFDF